MAGLKSSPFKTSWRSYSGGFEEFGFVFGGEGCGLGDEGFLLFFREFGCGGGASGDEDADFEEHFFLAGGRAGAEKTGGLVRGVVELVRGVGGDMEGFAGFNGGFLAAEGGFDLAFENGEGLFEVVTVWGWAATGWDEHVDQAVATGGVFAGEEEGVGVADHGDVREGLVVVGAGEGEGAGEVVGGDGHGGS